MAKKFGNGTVTQRQQLNNCCKPVKTAQSGVFYFASKKTLKQPANAGFFYNIIYFYIIKKKHRHLPVFFNIFILIAFQPILLIVDEY